MTYFFPFLWFDLCLDLGCVLLLNIEQFYGFKFFLILYTVDGLYNIIYFFQVLIFVRICCTKKLFHTSSIFFQNFFWNKKTRRNFFIITKCIWASTCIFSSENAHFKRFYYIADFFLMHLFFTVPLFSYSFYNFLEKITKFSIF